MTEKRKVIVDGQEFYVEVEVENGKWLATVEGRTFEIEIPDSGPVVKKRRAAGGKKKKSGTVSANIPGKIVTIEVEVGQEVTEGQVILILEAMKMQNEIQAPVNGKVVSVNCEEGQSIEANVPLVVIEPKEE
jgi:biotin carboxyl carrier protein